MKKTARTLLAGLFAIGLSAVAVPSPAYAACSEGYQDDVCVEISDITQVGGRKIVVQAEARTGGGDLFNCPSWKLSFSGESAQFVNSSGATGSGSVFKRTFDTDEVDEFKPGSATATCTFDDELVPTTLGGVGHLSASLVAALTTASATGQVNLLPSDDDSDDSDDSDDNGGLPNTGGERMLWLFIGLALVAGGATVIVTSRNRDAEA